MTKPTKAKKTTKKANSSAKKLAPRKETVSMGLPTTKAASRPVVERKAKLPGTGRLKQPANYEVG